MPVIQYLPPQDLKSWPRNARTHSKKQVRQLAHSIRRFGFTHPVLIDEHKKILAGHGRVQAALELGLAEVPCIAIDHLSESEKRAYVIADNKLALNSGWDRKLLADEMDHLLAEEPNFDIGVIGFSIAETDRMFEVSTTEDSEAEKDSHSTPPAPARCRPGDIWQLGPHRLICGHQVKGSALVEWWGDAVARMLITVPYKKLHDTKDAAEAESVWNEAALIAADEAGRRVIFSERDAARCDQIIHRWETQARTQAALISGETKKSPTQPEASI